MTIIAATFVLKIRVTSRRIESYLLVWISVKTSCTQNRMQHVTGRNGTILLHNGSDLLSWSEDGTVRLRNMFDGKQLREFNHGGPIAGSVLNVNESLLLTYDDEGLAHLWSLSDGSLILTTRQNTLNRLQVEG